jgi:putative ABC transport system permease protein
MKLPLWRRRQDAELDEELASHLRMAIADRVARGERPEEAARAARLEMGNLGLIKEVTRDMWGWTAVEQVAQDIRYARRTLGKSPGFTLVAVLTLALGIGANTAMFSVINAVLLRPLPFPNPDRLVAVTETDMRRGPNVRSSSVSWPNFFDWRSRAHGFDALSAYRDTNLTLTEGSRALNIDAAVVSSEFFSTLGVQPMLGHAFRIDDERSGSDVAMISDQLWRSQFDADPAVIGRALRLNGRRFTVIGVMPPRFRFPLTGPSAQLWVTAAEDARIESADDEPMTTQRSAHFLKVIGRLRPAATLASAQSELDVVAAALARDYPSDNARRGALVASQLETLVGDRRQPLLILFAAVGCVLLIACVNLANLLLARGADRYRELSVRTALGASRRRVVSQLLTESVVLSTVGTACGLAFAKWSLAALVRLSPVEVRGLDEVSIDGAVLAFTALMAVGSALAFGIIPALQAARTDPTAGLQATSRTTAGRSHRRVRAGLVVAETAIGVMLLVAAGLLLRNFNRLLHTSPGFDPQNVMTAAFRLPDVRYPYLKKVSFYEQLLAEIATAPGVEAVAATAPLPLSGSRYTISFDHVGSATAAIADKPSASFGMISPGYFRTMRIPFRRGRDFTAADDDAAPRVVIVNESFARTYFPGQDPIGQRIRPGLSTTEKESPLREIVGVVADIKHSTLTEPDKPGYFVPYAQGLISPLYLIVRTAGDPGALGVVEDIRKTLARKDAELALYDVKPLDAYLATSVASERFETLLLVVFAGLGLTLTAIGLYGVVAHGVAQRTREFGIRLALGARSAEVLGMVVRSGMALAGIGLAVGIVMAGFATRILATALHGIDPLDPVTFAAVAAVLLVVAMLASYIPARRATRVDPIRALRVE